MDERCCLSEVEKNERGRKRQRSKEETTQPISELLHAAFLLSLRGQHYKKMFGLKGVRGT